MHRCRAVAWRAATHHHRPPAPPAAGLYLGFLNAVSTISGINICVPRNNIAVLPYVKSVVALL